MHTQNHSSAVTFDLLQKYSQALWEEVDGKGHQYRFICGEDFKVFWAVVSLICENVLLTFRICR